MEEIKEKVLEEYNNGNVVFAGVDGLHVMPLNEFIKQDADDILYDLNRCEAVVLSSLPDPKWVNDYAVAKVIRALKVNIVPIDAQKDYFAKDEVWCDWYDCPKCKSCNVMFEDNYCSNCGCKFNWTGLDSKC